MKKYIIILTIAYVLFNPQVIQAPSTPQVMAAEVKTDYRIETLKNFLEKYHSNMASSAEVFIKEADKNNLDWRLLPAIAGAESTFGKFTPPCASYNPFGWTSTTSPCGYWRFENFDDAIRHVAQKISTNATYNNFRNTRQIKDLSIPYNGGNENWIKTVNFFMNELNEKNR